MLIDEIVELQCIYWEGRPIQMDNIALYVLTNLIWLEGVKLFQVVRKYSALCSTKNYYRAHESPSYCNVSQYVYTLSHLNTIYTIRRYLRNMFVISSLLHKPGCLARQFSLRSLKKNFCASLISSMRATYIWSYMKLCNI